jgi:tetratricopeptide (TPR) repeat protein
MLDFQVQAMVDTPRGGPGGPARHRTPRILSGVLPSILVFLLASCSTLPEPRTFDSVEHLRQRYAQRAGADAAADLAVPFELDETIRTVVEERLNPAQSERRRVDQVLDFVFGWLELEYELTPTRSAVETYRARRGNCLSFVNLFVGVARELRLNPFYVEVEDYQRWNFSEGTVVSHGHIVAGLRVDGKLATYDFLPYRAKSYRDFEPITDLKATAHYYNNLGAEALLAGDLATARRLTTIATDLAPGFEKAVNNLGVTLLRAGETERALEIFEQGLEHDPENVALLTNAARAYQRLGRHGEAERLLAVLEGVHHSNPFFYVYRGELALSQGDLDAALDYMKQAFRRDGEVPEVHVGLAKVYLALGDTDRARYHVERALKLDATHGEARRYAALLSGPPEPGSP